MFDAINPTSSIRPAEATQRQQATMDSQESAALTDELQTTGGAREGFLQEAERLTLLARMGVDIDTLRDIEDNIEALEALNERDESQQAELESLLEQRKELFREAMQRKNGEPLPPGSVLSISV